MWQYILWIAVGRLHKLIIAHQLFPLAQDDRSRRLNLSIIRIKRSELVPTKGLIHDILILVSLAVQQLLMAESKVLLTITPSGDFLNANRLFILL